MHFDKHHHYLSSFFLWLFFIFFASLLYANDEKQITSLLEKDEAPEGIVFEIVGDDSGEYLAQALDKVQAYTTQLREKFPKLDIAVVSHGSEQFNLTKDQAEQHKASHESVKQLFKSEIPVHICETHANWQGKTAEDFPDYINVAAEGPAQINQYKELGFVLVVID